MIIVFEDNDLPAVDQIRRHVFAIHEKLEHLVRIAKDVDGDSEIIGKINQFYGEVLLNFLLKFEHSQSKLRMVVEPGKSGEDAKAKVLNGKQVLRISPELHRKVSVMASKSGKCVNKWISDTLESA